MTDEANNAGAASGPLGSETVNRVRAAGNVWHVGGGQLWLPSAFGLCRGVERALDILARAVDDATGRGKHLLLLGQIIHNPWVNDYFRQRGVRVLTPGERERLEQFIGPDDCAVIPAFGVPLPVERRLAAIGCEIVDTTCGNVRRLWAWAERAVADGRAVLIFGRARHDETVVTKSRLAAAGGNYLVVGDLDGVDRFCDMIRAGTPADPAAAFGAAATNAQTMAPFDRLAQASQTTMLYDETMEVRRRVQAAFAERFAPVEADRRLLFEPTVCRATQNRQSAAVELCRRGPDLAVVVGGFGSSNTRHLHELARQYAPAYFIETVEAIRSHGAIESFDPSRETARVVRDWLPQHRPLRVAVLSGASTPEVLVGDVLERLADLLG
ncbi:MAG: hypothetical protein KGY99_06795 [Phycisphaerae bacterium]|nr:hypothetical protein [Phycisphaerae bacterium]